MKRRQFIRNVGLVGISHGLVGKALASEACCTLHAPLNEDAAEIPSLKLLQSLSLSEFHDEQEEGPCLVTNGVGGNWLFSLRRLPYPEENEFISCFTLENGEWIEKDPVFPKAGQYEAVTASCSKDGNPVVAWAKKENDDWMIMVSRNTGSEFGYPRTFRAMTGRYINPVLISPAPDRHWLAWEHYENGNFSICISRFENNHWTSPTTISEPAKALMHPAIAESSDGTLYLAYEVTDGTHRNIEMKQIDGDSLAVVRTIPVAIGGGLKDRVNLNTKPALAFDQQDRLWISYENNRNTSRLEDGDNFTGDRICAIVCYQNGSLKEPSKGGKWLFAGNNDHLPTFIKDNKGHLFLATHCGGDFVGNPFWKYRLAWLDPEHGWTQPETIHQTKQKGQTSRPSLIFDNSGHFWLAANPETWFEGARKPGFNEKDVLRIRASKMELHQFRAPGFSEDHTRIKLKDTIVEEHHPVKDFYPNFSGRPRVRRRQMKYNGETYTLMLGNLHEHSEISSCWPAGCDGTLHDDYRFGMFSEGYDFAGVTDHGYSLTEVYWRKNLRMAEFYDDPDHFVAVPSMEWTLSNKGNIEIGKGVGHKNVIFPSTGEALKFIRNKHEIFSWHSPETQNAVKLWQYLHRKNIDCVTIPHHPADEVHASDWDVHDPEYETVVEIFQCRGNAEYPGCPRVINVSRHKPTPNKKAFIDYALRDKQYKLGFIASGDHNGIGVGLAALWVKEVSREGIVEALKLRRCFGTTGDKIFVDFRVNGKWCGEVATASGSKPQMKCLVEAVQPLRSVEILRNSKVVHSLPVKPNASRFEGSFTDKDYSEDDGPAYYYLRAIQDNNHIAWSSPVWIEPA